MSEFSERIEQLRLQLGRGHITAHCVVDQAYAQNQHQTASFRHPKGGKAFYLSEPIADSYLIWMEKIASACITPDGSDVESAMIEVAEAMSQAVFDNAPKETGELDTSGHPFVERDGVPVYDRPPVSPRRPLGWPHV
jgi:hypothetical protein